MDELYMCSAFLKLFLIHRYIFLFLLDIFWKGYLAHRSCCEEEMMGPLDMVSQWITAYVVEHQEFHPYLYLTAPQAQHIKS